MKAELKNNSITKHSIKKMMMWMWICMPIHQEYCG